MQDLTRQVAPPGASACATSAGSALDAGEHNPSHARFQNPLGLGQRVVQTSAFLQLHFVGRRFIEQHLRGLATAGAHGINFECQPGRVSDWQCYFTFGLFHAPSIAYALANVIGRSSDF